MANGKAVGTIKIVIGEVKVIGVDGVARNAQVGDKVFAKETLVTAANAVVQVELENGRTLDLGRDSKLALDGEILDAGAGVAAAPAAAPAADVAAIQAQIAAGADPSQVAQATAAGGAPGAGGGAEGGGARSIVVIDQANTTQEVNSGFPTEPASITFPEPEFELLPVEELPIVSVSVQVGVDTEDPNGVVVSGNAASLIEGTADGTRLVNFIISLDRPFEVDVQVSYVITPVTADSPADFFDGTLSGTVTIPAGGMSFVVPIHIVQDGIDEGPNDLANAESFNIVLTGAVNATINPAANTAVVNIIDDDQSTVAISDGVPSTASEGTHGTITFTVTLSTENANTVTVNYTTVDGTAVAGSDYVAQNGTITFLPGETSKQIVVEVLNDEVQELAEAFTVQISNAGDDDGNPVVITDDSGAAAIVDDDAAPSFSINDVTRNEEDGTITFTITKTGLTTLSSSVDYTVNAGTAGTPGDYTGTLSGTVTFAAGETTKQITLNLTDDAVQELTEQFTVDLSNPSNATISDAQGVGTILDGDPAPSFSINDVTRNEEDGTITFTVTKTGLTTLASSVDYTVNAGTAGTPGDYTGTLSGTVAFAAGETTKTITLTLVDDEVPEADETFTVTLDNAVNGTISDGTGVGTILDTDPVIIAAGAEIITNSNSSQPGEQIIRLTISDEDGNSLESIDLDLFLQGQQGFAQFSNPIEFDAEKSYTVTLKYIQGSQQYNVTDVNLVDAQGNTVLGLLDQGNIQISGGSGSGNDGAIWVLTPSGSGFAVSEPIEYDLRDQDTDGLKEVILNTKSAGEAFALDLGLLSLDDDGDTLLNDDLFGDTELINIGGSSNEANTLILRASDVLNVTDGGGTLQITGNTSGAGTDTVVLVDQDGGGAGEWQQTAVGPQFTTYTYSTGVSVEIQTGLNVLMNQPDPLN